MTASVDELVSLAEYLPTFGVTSFFPTTVADTTENIVKAIKNVKEAQAKNKKGAAIAGIHIEGPFVNPKRKGAFDITKLRNPDIQEYDQFREAAEGMKIRMTAAPELPGSLELIRHITETGGSVTLGHTDATQAQAMEGLKNGANCFTHLFNAMKAGSKTLQLKMEQAPEEVADFLGIANGDKVIVLKRLRLANGEPMALEEAYLVYDLAPTLLECYHDGDSLYETLDKKCGIRILKAHQTIEIDRCDKKTAKLLCISHNDPVFKIRRIGKIEKNRPIEFVRSLYRADKYVFTVNLEI